MIKLKSLLEDKLKDYDRLKFYHNYYKNLTEDDIRAVMDINNTFTEFNFEFESRACDLYFWGIKK